MYSIPVVVEGQSNGRHPVMVARGVVTANDEAIPIRLLNLNTEEMMLHGRSCITTTGPVCETQIVESTHHSINAVGLSRHQIRQREMTVGRTDEQKELLFLLLRQYPDVFASHPEEYGSTEKIKHQIHTGDAAPI